MHIPSSLYDKSLLEDEPFSTGFFAIGSCDSLRSRKHDIDRFLRDMAGGLKGDEITAADAWIRLAFKASSSEGKKHRVGPSLETRRIFVIFFWHLSDHNPDRKEGAAANFLRQERSKRGYDYTPIEPVVVTTTVGTTIPGKKLRPSRRVINGTKRRVLDVKRPKFTQVKNNKYSGAGFEGAQIMSYRFEGPLKVASILQKNPLKNLLPPSVSLSESRQEESSPQVRPTVESLESPRTETVLLPSNREHSGMESPLPAMGACPYPNLPSKPTIGNEKDDVAMSPHEVLRPDKMDIEPLFLMTSRDPLADAMQCEIIPDTASEEGAHIPHISVSPMAHEIPSDRTSSLPQDLRISALYPESCICEEPTHTSTCKHSLDKFNLRDTIVKPPPPRYPLIWAQSRQEVCESFDWFRSYQGGVYYTHDYVRGYLLSAFSSMRDTFEHNGRMIISHGGGKAESAHSHQGKSVTQPADDQLAQDKSIRALLTNYRESRPLVLLVDDKYALFPYDLRSEEITYAVLGFYTISHVWAEYQPADNVQGRVVRYKFAFQWCDGQGEPWWTFPPSVQAEDGSLCSKSISPWKPLHDVRVESQQWACRSNISTDIPRTYQNSPAKLIKTSLSARITSMTDDLYATCLTCSQKSPKVYELAWVCLNPACPFFWFDTQSGRWLPYDLTYDPKFLQLSKPYLLPLNLRDIRPTPPEMVEGSIATTYAFTRGLHCRDCGRLSCRFKWEHWECMHCRRIVGSPGKLRAPEEFWNECLPKSFLDHSIQPFSGIWKEPLRLFLAEHGMARVQTFVLPDASGRIHHIQATTPYANQDADEIFKEYQEHALSGSLKFRRWPMRAHKCRGPLLTNYFSQNSGEPYQYVGGTANTVPFSETSSAVIKARNLIQLRISQALGIRFEFNEVLSAAYMERQRMAFHSDSERGLGRIVAGLSLGSPALMHFRPHHKFLREENFENHSIALTVVLHHGDILVMDGAEIQDRYEHTVVPTNFRIAATARNIASLNKTLK